MKPFRTEIRNAPNSPTVKIFLSDESLDNEVKTFLESLTTIENIEIRETIDRNRANENLTVFPTEHIEIEKLQQEIDNKLQTYFAKQVN